MEETTKAHQDTKESTIEILITTREKHNHKVINTPKTMKRNTKTSIRKVTMHSSISKRILTSSETEEITRMEIGMKTSQRKNSNLEE